MRGRCWGSSQACLRPCNLYGCWQAACLLGRCHLCHSCTKLLRETVRQLPHHDAAVPSNRHKLAEVRADSSRSYV
jgi:hypothetical protein